MKLHLLGKFNTIHNGDYSECPFTNKCILFPRMMQAQGFNIVEYANEGSTSEAREKVTVLTRPEFDELTAIYHQEHPGQPNYVGSKLCKVFEANMVAQLAERLGPEDIVLHPFGYTHQRLEQIFPDNIHLEISVGHLNVFSKHRVYESYAWWHYIQGLEKRYGNNYEWVIPLFYDVEEWVPNEAQGEYILYFGRVVADKGLEIVKEIARRVDRPVIICGSGDPNPYLDVNCPNLSYMPPVTGKARSELLRNAYCMLMPTQYTEPFGSSGVEGMLCGTPLIASDFGAFSETVWQGVTGYRCKTLGDWLYAVENAGRLDRKYIADYTRAKHNLKVCGEQYTRVFEQLYDLKHNKGFYNERAIMAVHPIR